MGRAGAGSEQRGMDARCRRTQNRSPDQHINYRLGDRRQSPREQPRRATISNIPIVGQEPGSGPVRGRRAGKASTSPTRTADSQCKAA